MTPHSPVDDIDSFSFTGFRPHPTDRHVNHDSFNRLAMRARVGSTDADSAFHVLSDFLMEHGVAGGFTFSRALHDPLMRFIGLERFSCPHDVHGEMAHWVSVWGFRPWEDIAHLAPGERCPSAEFVLLPPNGLTVRTVVGSPPDEPGRFEWEAQSTITIEPFFMARTPLAAAFDPNATRDTAARDTLAPPLSWDDARTMLRSFGLDLPWEGWWEYAARAGTSTRFYTGSAPPDVGQDERLDGNHPPLSRHHQNAFGLLGMTGYVWQWCRDVWNPNGVQQPPLGDEQRQHPTEVGAPDSSSGEDLPTTLSRTERPGHLHGTQSTAVPSPTMAALSGSSAGLEGEQSLRPTEALPAATTSTPGAWRTGSNRRRTRGRPTGRELALLILRFGGPAGLIRPTRGCPQNIWSQDHADGDTTWGSDGEHRVCGRGPDFWQEWGRAVARPVRPIGGG